MKMIRRDIGNKEKHTKYINIHRYDYTY